jgi:hypothetical protein
MRAVFAAFFLAAIAFFFRFTLGFSYASRFLTSERIPSFSMLFLNLRRATSNGSLSRNRMLGTFAYTPLLDITYNYLI